MYSLLNALTMILFTKKIDCGNYKIVLLIEP